MIVPVILSWFALNALAFYNWQIPYGVACLIAMPPSLVAYPFFYLGYQLSGSDRSPEGIWETTFFTVLFYTVLPILGLPYIIINTIRDKLEYYNSSDQSQKSETN